jgi:LPS-assembly protein
MRPVAPREWLAFTPVVGGRLTHYANTEGTVRAGDYTRALGELGADVALRSSGTFDYRNPRWKIDGLRHLLTPRLSYRYLPQADRGRARIPQIDREVFSTYLQPLGLGDGRNIDDLHATNTLRLSIDNTLQTRDPVLGSRDLVVFNVANDFRFRRRPGERDVSEIHTELALLPARWLQVDLYQSFAPRTSTVREFNAGVTLRDGTLWSLRFANNFLRREIEDYSIDGRFRITERFEAVTRLHYDARRRRFNEQTYGIAQNLGNMWLVSYNVSLYSGRRRESSFGFNVRVDVLGF